MGLIAPFREVACIFMRAKVLQNNGLDLLRHHTSNTFFRIYRIGGNTCVLPVADWEM
jgi:hypothetical protein